MKKILCIVVLSTYLILMLSTTVFGATPKLVNKLNSAFEDIESWIIKISTPAAAVAVCTGALMRKFSFGDEEKIKKRLDSHIVSGSMLGAGNESCPFAQTIWRYRYAENRIIFKIVQSQYPHAALL